MTDSAGEMGSYKNSITILTHTTLQEMGSYFPPPIILQIQALLHITGTLCMLLIQNVSSPQHEQVMLKQSQPMLIKRWMEKLGVYRVR